jgi:hypothetical protein
MKLLFKYILTSQEYNKHVVIYGNAIKKFGRWNNVKLKNENRTSIKPVSKMLKVEKQRSVDWY